MRRRGPRSSPLLVFISHRRHGRGAGDGARSNKALPQLVAAGERAPAFRDRAERAQSVRRCAGAPSTVQKERCYRVHACAVRHALRRQHRRPSAPARSPRRPRPRFASHPYASPARASSAERQRWRPSLWSSRSGRSSFAASGSRRHHHRAAALLSKWHAPGAATRCLHRVDAALPRSVQRCLNVDCPRARTARDRAARSSTTRKTAARQGGRDARTRRRPARQGRRDARPSVLRSLARRRFVAVQALRCGDTALPGTLFASALALMVVVSQELVRWYKSARTTCLFGRGAVAQGPVSCSRYGATAAWRLSATVLRRPAACGSPFACGGERGSVRDLAAHAGVMARTAELHRGERAAADCARAPRAA